VFYMSNNNLLSIVQNLLFAGADKTIPFLIVEQATTPNQRVQSFTLQSFFENPIYEFKSPAIIIMGKVTRLYQDFAWFQNENPASGNYFRSIEAEKGYLKIQSSIQQKSIENVDRTKTQII
jgi:hypothetical protein